MNALVDPTQDAAAQAGSVPGPAPSGPRDNIAGAFARQHDQAQALFDKTGKGLEHGAKMAQALQGLTRLGNAVQPDDVIEAAGKLVASGSHSPTELATVLADMPTSGGQALAGWVAQHTAQNAQVMTQLGQMHALTRHELGASALRMIAAHGSGGGAGGSTGVPPATAGGNALLPGSSPHAS